MQISAPLPSVCPLVLLLYSQSPFLRVLFLAQSVASFASLVVLVFGILRLITRPLVSSHLGNTVLLLNLCLSLLLGNVGVLLSTLYHLHVPLFRPSSSHCFWLSFSLGDCLMIRSLFNVSLFSAYSSGVCFALERVFGSLLLLRSGRAKGTIAVSLAILQWLLALLAVLPPKFSSDTLPESALTAHGLFPHCAMLTPSPTKLHPHFFVLLGMQIFVLAIFSILTYHNHFDPMTKCELARHNPIVHAQVLATEHSLPIASFTVALFLLNTLLDRSFLRTIIIVFGGKANGENEANEGAAQRALRDAIWSEFQTLALPLTSFLFVWILSLQNRNQLGASPAGAEEIERMGKGQLALAKEKSKEMQQTEKRNGTTQKFEEAKESIKEKRPLKRTQRLGEGAEKGTE